MSHYRREEEALGADIPDDGLDDEVGCYYPGRCAIPELHVRAACTVRAPPSERSQPDQEVHAREED